MRRIAALVVLFAIAGLASGACEARAAKDDNTTNDVPVATLLYVSHGFQQTYPYEATGGRGTTGWNVYGPPGADDPFPWTGFTTTWPEIGWYASKDLDTVAWQISQMQRAGIDTIVISWFGWGDTKLDNTIPDPNDLFAQYQDAAIVVLDHIKNNDIPMKFALLTEAFTYFVGDERLSTNDLTDEQRQTVTDYAWDNFYAPSKYGDFALQIDGKPALLSVPDVKGGWWRNHDWTDDRFRLIEISNNHEDEDEFTTDYVYLDPPSTIPGVDGVVNVWPRFSSVVTYASNTPYFPWYNPPTGGDPDEPANLPEVDPLGTEGKYDDAWRQIIEHPRRSEVKMVFIWYWNSYWEVCYIEPDAGVGAYAVGDLYVRKTAHYADIFRSGKAFQEFDEADESSRHIGDVKPVLGG